MSKPDLSVIIPVYNGADTIGVCLDSILRQNGMRDNEIVVINDGSRDETGKIVRQYQSQHDNILLLNQKNAGVSAARNNGIDISSGKYVSFVDADDTVGLSWESMKPYFDSYDTRFSDRCGLKISHRQFDTMPEFDLVADNDFYVRMLTAALKYKADIALAGKITFNYDAKYIRRHMYDKTRLFEDTTSDKRALLIHADVRENANFALYDRDFLNHSNLRFETSMPLDEDILFTMLAVLHASAVVSVPESAYVYNRCAGTASNIIDTTEAEFKYARAIVQRFSKLLPQLAVRPEWAALYTEWLHEYWVQGHDSSHLREYMPNDGCISCDCATCGDCIMRQILDEKNAAAQRELFQKQR